MLRPFSFLNTGTETPEQRNWRTFDEASKTLVKGDLSMTSGTGDTTVPYGYFTQYGPIVFYSLTISIPDGDGWTISSYILMPFEALVNNSIFRAPHLGHVFYNATGLAICNSFFGDATNPNRLYFSTGYTNTSGGTETIPVHGWYYRN